MENYTTSVFFEHSLLREAKVPYSFGNGGDSGGKSLSPRGVLDVVVLDAGTVLCGATA